MSPANPVSASHRHQYAMNEVQAMQWAVPVGQCRHCERTLPFGGYVEGPPIIIDSPTLAPADPVSASLEPQGRKLTAEEWQAIRDSDARYLDDLAAALSASCATVMDAMYGVGLRIVREDREDPPQQAIIERIQDLITRWDAKGAGDYAGRIPTFEVTAALRKVLEP